MRSVRGLGHVALLVDDLEASVRFYVDVLGLQVSDRATYEPGEWLAEGAWLRSGTEHHCLALFRAADGKVPKPTDGLHHLAFKVDAYEDLLDAKRELERQGSEIVAMRHYGPGSQVRLYCLDPAGYRVELYWGLDSVGWDGVTRPFLPIEDIDLETYDPAELEDYKRRTTEAAQATAVTGPVDR